MEAFGVAPPSVHDLSDGGAPRCPECDHSNGTHGWTPFRRVLIRLRLPVSPITCGSTQWYEDDELFSCGCRASVHSG